MITSIIKFALVCLALWAIYFVFSLFVSGFLLKIVMGALILIGVLVGVRMFGLDKSLR